MKKTLKKKTLSKKADEAAVKSQEKKNQPGILKWFLLAGVLALTLFIYYPALENEWTNWDDRGYVLENPLTQNLNAETLKTLFNPNHQEMGNYHPLPMISLALDWKMYGDDAKGFHRTAVIFHLLNTALVFFFILLLLESAWAAAIVAALFAVHPAHTESVAWISERKDVMYVCFYLLSLIFYLMNSKMNSVLTYSLCLFTFLLSLLSKGQAVTLPVVLLGIDYLQKREWKWKTLIEKIPFFVLSIVFGLLAVKAQAMSKSIADIPYYNFYEKMLFAAYSLFSYFYKAIFPSPLSAFYPYPLKGMGYSWLIWCSPVLLLLIAAIVFWKFRTNRVVIFGLGFFLVNVALILQILPVGAAIMADRYTYLAYIGLFILIAYASSEFSKRFSSGMMKQVFYLAVVVLIITQSVLAYDRIAVWKNSETLWLDTIKKYEYAPVAHNNLGSYYQKNNRLEEALNEFNEAIRLQPKYPEALINRSDIFRVKGNTQQAINDCTHALQYNPDYPGAHMNRGIALSIAGKYDSAYRDFKLVLIAEPNNSHAYSNLGNLLDMQGKTDSALMCYNRAIEIEPTYADCYKNRARSNLAFHHYDAALSDINYAISAYENDGSLYATRADIEFAQNNFQAAIDDATRAQQLGFNINPAYFEMLKQKLLRESK